MRPHKSPALGTVLLLLALNLLNYLDRYILPGAQPLVQKEFHSTDQQMGALTTALFFFYMFAAPASGLPSFPTAFDAHVASCAIAEPHVTITASTAANILPFIEQPPLGHVVKEHPMPRTPK